MAEGLRFEREVCSRCCGTGQYSYCEMYGTTCFKCAGKGETLTTRGKAAAMWMNRQNLITAEEVKVGMRIKALGLIITVVSIERSTCQSKSLNPATGEWIVNPLGWSIQGQKYGMEVPPGFGEIQLIRSNAEQVELLRKAIEYQGMLTKEGKPRKRQAAEAAQ